MCRFLAYLGPEILMAELLYRPDNSLIKQSRAAKELRQPVNGDGFGIGWYGANAPSPCVFTSVVPAWSNRNLSRLAEHIASNCFFAHVRAASPGMPVSEGNCHPFTSGRYLWMHNGVIDGFASVKRDLCNMLPESLYLGIQGNTDSEHAFALFLSFVGGPGRSVGTERMGRALGQTVAAIERLRSKASVRGPSHCNFAVTDGESLAAVRFVSDPHSEPISLYLATGSRFLCRAGSCRLVKSRTGVECVILASERLTARTQDWKRVAPNHVVTVNSDRQVEAQLLEWTEAAPARA